MDRNTDTEKMIKKGDKVTIREEFRDVGDHYQYVAAEDSHDSRGVMPRLKIYPVDTGLAIPPVWVVQPHEIHETF